MEGHTLMCAIQLGNTCETFLEENILELQNSFSNIILSQYFGTLETRDDKNVEGD